MLHDGPAPERASRLAHYARSPADRAGAGREIDVETASKAARRSLDLALYGLVGFGLIFGLAAVLKGHAARSALAMKDVDRSLITKANWAIALGIFDMFVAPGLGFLIIGGLVYYWIT
jgi:hypothetical protein